MLIRRSLTLSLVLALVMSFSAPIPAAYAQDSIGTGFVNTNITVSKCWQDGDNADGIRPPSATFQLYGNGVAVGVPVDVSASNSWSWTWPNLPTVNANSEIITYTVQETAIPGYEPTYLQPTVTQNGPNLSKITPNSSLTISAVSNIVIAKKGGNYVAWTLLPLTQAQQMYVKNYMISIGVEGFNNNSSLTFLYGQGVSFAFGITVTATEVQFTNPSDWSWFYYGAYSATNVPGVVTNTHVPATISKTVTKSWNDANNQDGIRPAAVMVQLLADGEAADDPVELNVGNSWSYTWPELQQKKAGVDIVYTIAEITAVTGYTTTYSPDTFTITNTHTPAVTSKTVTKVWDDADNQDGIRPAAVSVQLLADGTPVGTPVELNVGNSWAHTWGNLPVNKAGTAIVYTVAEITAIEGYKATYDQTTLTITNYHKPEVTTKTVTKVWMDSDNVDKLRPASVKVQLLANGSPVGVPVDLSVASKWAYTWENLPVNKAGAVITYTVKEITIIDGYKTTYDQKTLTITNVHVPAKVIIPKTGDNSSGYGLTFLLGFIGVGALGFGIYLMRKRIRRGGTN
ncbi:MAG: Cna B-type domain-containing protein [Candidatus Bathyarchaeota archaeon]|nr:Cna B-type domain-containing protein [Candidatus Bathyarchaeota archaeon]